MRYVLIFLLAFSFGCKSTITNQGSQYINMSEFKVISQGNLMGDGKENIDEGEVIINNRNDWDTLLSKLNSVNNISKKFNKTPVDFSTEIVVCLFDKIRPSAGYAIEVNQINHKQNDTSVNYSVKKPTGMVTTVITQPYYMFKMKKRKGKFNFVKN